MKLLPPIVAAGIVVLSGVAGCLSSTTGGSVAEVTGFAYVGFIGVAPSGPVTVRITGVESSRLALLVGQLPSVPQYQAHCEEGLGLMYRIAFGAGAAGQSKTVVEGYQCDAAVTVTVAGHASSWRRDSTCALLRAVRHVLPGRAKATRSLSIGCDS
jgi:hypothetical protein